MVEPGLDRHEWESEWESLADQIRDAPAESLKDLGDLVSRMLDARGYAVEDPVVREGDDREVVAEFLAAREIAELVDAGSDSVSPGDVAAAINAYRSIFEYVLEERPAP